MTIHVVNFKETFFNDDGTKVVNSGVCGKGFLKEADAKRKCDEEVDNRYNMFLGDNDAEMEKDDHNDMIYDESNECGRWHCFHHYGDTYEYWVSDIEVEGL